ncbi:hypothetical protein B9N43_01715 [Denitratisoma sp. DHT3]|uniref:TetR-like C-terminal domain-containing protein n=1 Tax=Denitratisoma sp. DHT3 TaxID=1981880 RepID=UPI001198A7D9|nr:TetR-like C-terminal domain-containing protein [Denitratisoma sp. DHT3]QDX80083.1 hypothetical protein B9N43_01715 [Denitratisoma sp. DHT3]
MDTRTIEHPKSLPGTIRTGGRTERIRQQVAQAVLALVRDGNFHFDVRDVVARSGVHKTTIYRRWPTRQALINEAFREHNTQIKLADTGTWAGDLMQLCLVLRNFFSLPSEIAFNAALAMNGNESLTQGFRESWLPVQAQLEQVVERAQARGEVRRDVAPSLITRLLTSPLLTTIMFEKRMPEDAELATLVDFLVAATQVRRRSQLHPAHPR